MLKRRIHRVGASTVALEFGDITTSKADVLVSSDDLYLTMGGGVSAAICRAAGQQIILDAAKKVPAKLGDVVVTGAGSLPAKHVFHAITIANGKAIAGEVVTLATRRSLTILKALGLSSIAFPTIGAGVAGFSLEDVAANMADAIFGELRDFEEPLSVTIYLFDRFGQMRQVDYDRFLEEFDRSSRAPKRGARRTGCASHRCGGAAGPIEAKDGRHHNSNRTSQRIGRTRSRTRNFRGPACTIWQWARNRGGGEN